MILKFREAHIANMEKGRTRERGGSKRGRQEAGTGGRREGGERVAAAAAEESASVKKDAEIVSSV